MLDVVLDEDPDGLPIRVLCLDEFHLELHDRSTMFFSLGMNAIQRIKTKLSTYPDVRYSESADGIEVHPRDQSGFTVGLRITRSGFTVYFEGWHEEFTSEDEALDCFAFGLSPKCRLAIVFRGDTETKWVVEGFRNGGWTPDSETGLLLQPFWRPARVEYRQNRVLNAGSPEGAR